MAGPIAYPDINTIIGNHIKDPGELAVIDYYQKQFARLHQFPTCLGKAIFAFEEGRDLEAKYRDLMQNILTDISKYLAPDKLTGVQEQALIDQLSNDLKKLRSDILADPDAKFYKTKAANVFESLSASFPSPLEHVHHR